MSTELATVEPTHLPDIAPAEMEALRRVVGPAAKEMTDLDLQLFWMQVESQGVKALSGDIIPIVTKDKRTGNVKITRYTTIDCARRLAESSRLYAGQSQEYGPVEAGHPAWVKTIVRKFVGTPGNPQYQLPPLTVEAVARWSEYGKDGFIWRKMPYVMLAKCSEMLALRKAFPGQLNHTYSMDELGMEKDAHGNAQEVRERVHDVLTPPADDEPIDTEATEIDPAAEPEGPPPDGDDFFADHGKEIVDAATGDEPVNPLAIGYISTCKGVNKNRFAITVEAYRTTTTRGLGDAELSALANLVTKHNGPYAKFKSDGTEKPDLIRALTYFAKLMSVADGYGATNTKMIDKTLQGFTKVDDPADLTLPQLKAVGKEMSKAWEREYATRETQGGDAGSSRDAPATTPDDDKPDWYVDPKPPTPRSEPQPFGACPKCGKELVEREGKHGPFLACPGYPECKHTENLP